MATGKNSEAYDYGKKRNWWIIVYQDSAPENWKNILEETGKQVAISPLHDEDVDAKGNIREPHWHVIISYKGPTTYATVKKLADKLNTSIVKPIERLSGAFNYLTHKNSCDPMNHDYSDREDEIILMNGFALKENKTKPNPNVTIHRELRQHAYENNITSLRDSKEYAMKCFGDEGVQYVDQNTYYIKTMLQDVKKRQRKDNRRSDSFDHEARPDQMEQRIQALEDQNEMLLSLLKFKLRTDPKNPID